MATIISILTIVYMASLTIVAIYFALDGWEIQPTAIALIIFPILNTLCAVIVIIVLAKESINIMSEILHSNNINNK